MRPGSGVQRTAGSEGALLSGLTSWQSSRELTSWTFWQDKMEPARFSITHTAERSMKKVIWEEREREEEGRGEGEWKEGRGDYDQHMPSTNTVVNIL